MKRPSLSALSMFAAPPRLDGQSSPAMRLTSSSNSSSSSTPLRTLRVVDGEHGVTHVATLEAWRIVGDNLKAGPRLDGGTGVRCRAAARRERTYAPAAVEDS